MLLILGVAESSDALEPIFAYGDREVRKMKGAALAPIGARLMTPRVRGLAERAESTESERAEEPAGLLL